MNNNEPKYFILVNDCEVDGIEEYQLVTELDNKSATYRVNKFLANGYELENLKIICGYEVPIRTGGEEGVSKTQFN